MKGTYRIIFRIGSYFLAWDEDAYYKGIFRHYFIGKNISNGSYKRVLNHL